MMLKGKDVDEERLVPDGSIGGYFGLGVKQ